MKGREEGKEGRREETRHRIRNTETKSGFLILTFLIPFIYITPNFDFIFLLNFLNFNWCILDLQFNFDSKFYFSLKFFLLLLFLIFIVLIYINILIVNFQSLYFLNNHFNLLSSSWNSISISSFFIQTSCIDFVYEEGCPDYSGKSQQAGEGENYSAACTETCCCIIITPECSGLKPQQSFIIAHDFCVSEFIQGTVGELGSTPLDLGPQLEDWRLAPGIIWRLIYSQVWH